MEVIFELIQKRKTSDAFMVLCASELLFTQIKKIQAKAKLLLLKEYKKPILDIFMAKVTFYASHRRYLFY